MFVAMRDIEAGEELTHDWATTDDSDFELPCQCGSPRCRGVVSGTDWMKPELQERYRGWFCWHIQRKLEAMEQCLSGGDDLLSTNLLDGLPASADEVFQDIVRSDAVRIERIVSHGQSSPAVGWYDQREDEWVMLLQGAARLVFEDGRPSNCLPATISAFRQGPVTGSHGHRPGNRPFGWRFSTAEGNLDW